MGKHTLQKLAKAAQAVAHLQARLTVANARLQALKRRHLKDQTCGKGSSSSSSGSSSSSAPSSPPVTAGPASTPPPLPALADGAADDDSGMPAGADGQGGQGAGPPEAAEPPLRSLPATVRSARVTCRACRYRLIELKPGGPGHDLTEGCFKDPERNLPKGYRPAFI